MPPPGKPQNLKPPRHKGTKNRRAFAPAALNFKLIVGHRFARVCADNEIHTIALPRVCLMPREQVGSGHIHLLLLDEKFKTVTLCYIV
jgi:hypothetical protein